MAHPLALDAATTLRLPQALEEAEAHYLRALKAALARNDAVQVVAPAEEQGSARLPTGRKTPTVIQAETG